MFSFNFLVLFWGPVITPDESTGFLVTYYVSVKYDEWNVHCN